MSKRFINAPTEVVPDLMHGLSLDSSRVTLLDPSTGHNVALRASLAANTQTPRVSVVSGGGSGHEPMAAGYVGDGMLAGAVAGGVFSSPSVTSISAMLEAVAPRSTGILVVVMNYQGDRLNFGMAVKELLKNSPGYPIHITLVSDDVALPNIKEKRGIAGTVFVLKVAGAAADQGRPFQEVVNIAETAARSIVSYGVALEPCTIPGHSVDTERLTADEVELGMGIHGEPGAEKQLLSNLNKHGHLTHELVSIICSRLDQAMQKKAELMSPCTGLAVLVNNLGAVSQAEMLIITKGVSDFLYNRTDTRILNGNIYRVHLFVGSFMTSLQMTGVSVSCFMLPSDGGIMDQFLHAPTECAAWVTGFELFPPAQRTFVPRLHPESNGGRLRRRNTGPIANVYFPTAGPAGGGTTTTTIATATATASVPVNPVPFTKPKLSANPTTTTSSNVVPIASVSTNPSSGTTTNNSTPAPKVYAGAKALSGAAGTITGLSSSTENNILTITSSLQTHCDELTRLDRRTGDGDLGDTVHRGCTQIRDDLQNGRYAHAANNPSELFKAIAGSTEAMGGSSGILTRVFLLEAADKLEQLQQQQPQKGYDGEVGWRAAFVAGTKGVMQQGKARVGDRTLVDALKPAADIFERNGKNASVADAARAARRGYDSTKAMTTAQHGRSANVRADRLANYPDPGALAICIILESLIDIL